MSERRTRTFAYAYLLNIAGKLADIVYFVLLVGAMSKSQLGLVNTLLAASAFAYLFVDLGLVQASLRHYSRQLEAPARLLRGGLSYRLLIFIVLMVLSALVPLHDSSSSLIFTALGYQLASFFTAYSMSWLRGGHRQTIANLLVCTESVLRLVLLWLVLRSFETISAQHLLLGLLFVKLVFMLISVVKVYRYSQHMEASSAACGKGVFLVAGQATFFSISLITVIQNRVDWLLVSYWGGLAKTADYSVANRLYEIVLFILGIGFSTMYPWLCRLGQGPDKTIADARGLTLAQYALLACSPIVVAVTLAIFPLINKFVWSGEYLESIAFLKILMPCVVISTANILLYHQLLAANSERAVFKVSVIATILQVMVNIFLIRKMGGSGAVAGMWVLNTINLALYAYLVARAGGSIITSASLFIIPLSVSVVMYISYQYLDVFLAGGIWIVLSICLLLGVLQRNRSFSKTVNTA
ncbi:MAG: oligosaccharide flippase family protein [Gammaproteobacteria bacterium]|nr:oligosaccharide flippase family protein [Gammaproteobacteria bacterium]MBQ0840682.1 oligosaccharide flippase family protein [Gammaproteobacteria bacterium]